MTGPKQRLIVDGVEFATVFRFWRILRSITAALQPPRLVVALLMIVLLIAAGRLWDGLTEPTIHPQGLLAGAWSERDSANAEAVVRETLGRAGVELAPDAEVPTVTEAMDAIDERYRSVRAETPDDAMYLDLRGRLDSVRLRGPYEASAALTIDAFRRVVDGIVTLKFDQVYAAGADLFVRFPCALWAKNCVFALGYGLLVLIVIAIGGGAISRMAACDFAGQERLRVREAFDFALGNWVKLVLTPLLPLVIAGGLAVAMIVVGLLMAPWADVLGGPLYVVNILLGLLLAFVLLGYAVSFPLLIPSIACENCDAADAQQRAYGYVISRPLNMLSYVVILLAGLSLGFVVVAVVASAALNFTASLSGLIFENSALVGAGDYDLLNRGPVAFGAIHEAGHNAWAAGAVNFWIRVIIDLVAAWVVSYLFTASTMVYLLMRRACDGQDVDEVWRPGYIPGTLVPVPREEFVAGRGGGD